MTRTDITRVREKLEHAAFIAHGLSENLMRELSSIAGCRFGEPRSAVPPERPVVVVGASPAIAVPADRLVWFHTTNAGVDDVLASRDLAAETLLTRTVGSMGRKVAEYVLAWILARSQHVHEHHLQTQARRWNRLVPQAASGQTVVVYGVGRIGHSIADLLRGLGIRVVGVARGAGCPEHFDEVRSPSEVLSLLPEASWVISTLPLTERTRDYFGREIFSLLRGAYFINAGRGSTVVFEDLLDALENGRVKGAVIDVLPAEPPDRDDRWWALPNTTFTSHSAGITSDSDVVEAFSACWSAIQRGELPELTVDRDRGY